MSNNKHQGNDHVKDIIEKELLQVQAILKGESNPNDFKKPELSNSTDTISIDNLDSINNLIAQEKHSISYLDKFNNQLSTSEGKNLVMMADKSNVIKHFLSVHPQFLVSLWVNIRSRYVLTVGNEYDRMSLIKSMAKKENIHLQTKGLTGVPLFSFMRKPKYTIDSLITDSYGKLKNVLYTTPDEIYVSTSVSRAAYKITFRNDGKINEKFIAIYETKYSHLIGLVF